jgi:hypothetical protein
MAQTSLQVPLNDIEPFHKKKLKYGFEFIKASGVGERK